MSHDRIWLNTDLKTYMNQLLFQKMKTQERPQTVKNITINGILETSSIPQN